MAIKPEQLYELLKDAFQNTGTCILNETDENIEYYMFEDFDIAVSSFMHENSLTILLTNGLINQEIALSLTSIRNSFLSMKEETRTADSVKNNQEWLELLLHIDDVKKAFASQNGQPNPEGQTPVNTR
jgi:hypothetical protein